MWLKTEKKSFKTNKRRKYEIDIAKIFNGQVLEAFIYKDGRVHSIMDLENIQIGYRINISDTPIKSLGSNSVQYKHSRTEVGTASIMHEINEEMLKEFNSKGIIYFYIAKDDIILHCESDNINEIIENGIISFNIIKKEFRN